MVNVRGAMILSALFCVHHANAAIFPTKSALWNTPKNILKSHDVHISKLSGGSGADVLASLGSSVPDSFLANTENFAVRKNFEEMLRKAQVLCQCHVLYCITLQCVIIIDNYFLWH